MVASTFWAWAIHGRINIEAVNIARHRMEQFFTLNFPRKIIVQRSKKTCAEETGGWERRQNRERLAVCRAGSSGPRPGFGGQAPAAEPTINQWRVRGLTS